MSLFATAQALHETQRANVYGSDLTAGVVVSVALTGVGLLAASRGFRHLGLAMMLVLPCWLLGLVASAHWLIFALAYVGVISHQLSPVVRERVTKPTQSPEPIAASTLSIPDEASVIVHDRIGAIRVMTRADEYNEAIQVLEVAATRVDKTLLRLNTVFKDEALAREVARQRYGARSRMYQTYVAAHQQRRKEFFRKLGDGELDHREICPLSALTAWINAPIHPDAEDLTADLIVAQVRSVIDTLRRYPANYSLALSDSVHPFRYAIFDTELVVIHEALGAADMHRVNALFIEEAQAVAAFEAEFELLWQRIPLSHRDNEAVALRLESLLLDAGLAEPPAEPIEPVA